MNNVKLIVPIVEGHGEVEALPLLLRRIAAEINSPKVLRINPPLRIKSGSFLNDQVYFSRYLELAARKAAQEQDSCILILLDSEDDCPGTLGPTLLERARYCRSDANIIVLLAHREFETWFLAAAHSLRGKCGLPVDLEAPSNPEAIRDAKGWIASRMGSSYIETEHQPRLTDAFDFSPARTIHSFERTLRKIEDILR